MQQANTTKTRRIRQISVTNLFGIFNHTIPLKMDALVTIIHGANGFGKTAILNLLHALFSSDSQLPQNPQPLQDIPFDEFRVDFEDNTSFWVSKTSRSHESIEDEHPIEHEIVFHASERKPYTLPQPLRPEDITPLSQTEHLKPLFLGTPNSNRSTSFFLQNMQTGEILSSEDIVDRLGDRLPAELIRRRTPEWLTDMRKSVPTRFIETQRLLSSSKPFQLPLSSNKYAVIEDSTHLVEVIRKKQAESATLSQSLDRTFPARLISPTIQQSQVTEDELLDKLQKLEKKRSRLMTVGLLDQEEGTNSPIGTDQEIAPSTKAVLAVYADDTEQKLGIFDELAQKIDLLTTIINSCFSYKRMTINKENGLVFTTENGTNLPLENLSSGEQHELVLFYDLLFRVSPGSLILIDEPELSLHVGWQRKFLKDIQQVTQLTNIDIILATHSPSLISDRRDLLVRLKGPEDGR